MALFNRGEIVTVSPHPDDEVIGAGPTLMRLGQAGYNIVNLAISLGRPEQEDRRRKELTEACSRAGFELIVPEERAAISSGNDLVKAQRYIGELLADLIVERQPQVVVTPSIHDGHHGHEVVARAVRDTLKNSDQPVSWWMYKIWGDLPHPTIYSPFDKKVLNEALHALDAHAGENERNDYRRFLEGNALADAIGGSEKVFGYGAPNADQTKYANLLTEVSYVDGKWLRGEPRVLDVNHALSEPTDYDLTPWVTSPSPYQVIREHNAPK